ncbi:MULTISPECIES: 4-hydroxy-tetrahydrodipicolinate synthase [Sphingobium]|uniref:4-hydroxy-tetrahydrodipicolinate synthase n=1 Tax=Sphingobium lignivorans TaxID=2735886 RepID=A0ABR6NE87_9SPHN|nr:MULTISPECIES: 4-hydroxy-tetrahydrodipicolinate synthase [Sphingobium]MBB5985571.1 4-hydroxy-tetrahydrodipicolinate synthase [Sphingobium lignivorans]BAK66191.1 dihydrodipicolinate synthase [Sphingobium sp. SYK-6]
MFSGSIPALVTPFRDGRVDEAAFRAFVDWQIAEGSSALVPCGTTGESATMTIEEHNRVVRICVEQAAGRVPVIAGCGSNDTRIALEHMFAAQAAGAAAALVVAPYYNKPNQEGVYQHFAYLASRCDLPIVLYNVPSRTITDIGIPVMHRLAEEFSSIVGVKDATGNLGRVTAQRLACGPDFCQLSGNDETALGFNAMGGRGCISVTANIAPHLCAQFQNACLSGDWDTALHLQDRLYPLHDAMFCDSSPGPVKYALSRLREDMPAEVRLPITWPSGAARATVDRALEIAGLV